MRGRRVLAPILATAVGVMVIACAPGRSHLTVQNLTAQPIVFKTGYGDAFAEACGTVELEWHGDWKAEPGGDHAIEGAIRLTVTTRPPPDSAATYAVIVTSEAVSRGSGVASLPPCGGAAPSGASGG